MKKIVSLLLVLVMMLGLAACGTTTPETTVAPLRPLPPQKPPLPWRPPSPPLSWSWTPSS